MSKGIDELKDWAMHNVRLISILPSNKNLPVDVKLTDVLEHDVDEKYFLSEERTAQLLKEFPRDLPDGVDGFNKADGDVSYALTTRTASCYPPHHVETSQATLISTNDIKQIGNIDQYKRDRNNPNSGRVYDPSGISPTLSTMQGGGREQKIIQPVLTPDRMEKRQNGRRFKEDGEPMFTLTSQDRHGIAIREATETGFDIATTGDSVNIQYPESETRRGRVGKGVANTLEASGINQGVVNKDFRIRKLTPLECFRLQGFTDEQFYKAKNAGVSDSQLYKQAGNSVTVNVIDAIARRL